MRSCVDVLMSREKRNCQVKRLTMTLLNPGTGSVRSVWGKDGDALLRLKSYY